MIIDSSISRPSAKPRSDAADLALLVIGGGALLIAIVLWFDNAQGGLTGNGVFKSLELKPWVADPANAPLYPANYLYYPLMGALCRLLFRGQIAPMAPDGADRRGAVRDGRGGPRRIDAGERSECQREQLQRRCDGAFAIGTHVADRLLPGRVDRRQCARRTRRCGGAGRCRADGPTSPPASST